jgi:hypothetical protein
MVLPVFITIVVFSIFVAIVNAMNNKKENGDYGWDEFANAMIVGAIASVTNLTFYFCFKYLSTL